MQLVKTGGGTLILTGQNTYTGGTDIEGGTLQLGDGIANNGSVTGNIIDNSALAFANPTAQTYSGAISGSGAVYVDGLGVLTLRGGNTYTGLTTINGGTLRLGDGVANNGSVAGNIIDNSTLAFANPTAQTYRGIISGRGAVFVDGPGALTLTGANTYTGGTTITGGTLQLGDGARNNGSVTGNIIDNSALAFANFTAQTYRGVISGSGALYADGPGVLTLTATNAYTGGTNVNGGILSLAGPNNPTGTLPAGTTLNINNGGTVRVDGVNALGGYGDNNIPSVIIHAGGLLTMSNGMTCHLNSLTLAGGTLSSTTSPSGTWGSWSFDGPVDATANSTINAYQMSLNGGTFTVAAGVTLSVPGTFIGSSLTLTSSSAGTMEMSGVNAYGGATNVNGGILGLAGPNNPTGSTLPAGTTLNINNGGTVRVDGVNALGGYGDDNIPSVIIHAGGLLTMSNGMTCHLNSLTLAGGTLSSTTSPSGTWGSWSFDGPVDATANSTINAYQMSLNGGTFTVAAGVTLSVPGTFIGSSLTLTSSSAGTMEMSGVNAYGGATNVNGGILGLAGPNNPTGSTLPAGTTLNINNGGTVRVDGVNALGGYGDNNIPSVIIHARRPVDHVERHDLPPQQPHAGRRHAQQHDITERHLGKLVL